jgi:hypothetical protein
MTQTQIRPTTLSGIKSLAGDLKKSLGIKHFEALQQASIAAGYQNLAHARAALAHAAPASAASLPRHTTIILRHWKDRDNKQTGTEALAIDLAHPFGELIPSQEVMEKHNLLHGYWVYDRNQLIATSMDSAQAIAHFTICQTARVLQFMDVTGLRPSRSTRRIYPGNSSRNRIPGADHTHAWYDPKTRGYLMTDEPYESRAEELLGKRMQWAQTHDYDVHKVGWLGMYAPDVGSRLHLVGNSQGGIDLIKMKQLTTGRASPYRSLDLPYGMRR